MKKRSSTSVLILTAALLTGAGANSAQAGTVVTSAFNKVTSGAISTTGLADWGYLSVTSSSTNGSAGFFDSGTSGVAAYTDTAFGSVYKPTPPSGTAVITTVSLGSTIGSVTLTENGDVINGQTNGSNFTFGGSTAYGSYGGFAASEQDIWTMAFNDLGIGTFDITLYMGHSDDGRKFDMDYVLTDDGATSGTTAVPTNIGALGSTVDAYGTSGSAFTYDIRVSTTTAGADLSLTFGGVSGGSGGAVLAGYTVAAVPEPSAALLGGLGLLALLRRRR